MVGKCLLVLVAAFSTLICMPGFADDTGIILPGKSLFYDGATLSAVGAMRAPNLAYKNNTIRLTCYKSDRICLLVTVEQIGENQIGTISLPAVYQIREWLSDKLTAERNEIPCVTLMLNINFVSRTVKEKSAIKDSDKCKIKKEDIVEWELDSPPSYKRLLEAK